MFLASFAVAASFWVHRCAAAVELAANVSHHHPVPSLAHSTTPLRETEITESVSSLGCHAAPMPSNPYDCNAQLP